MKASNMKERKTTETKKKEKKTAEMKQKRLRKMIKKLKSQFFEMA